MLNKFIKTIESRWEWSSVYIYYLYFMWVNDYLKWFVLSYHSRWNIFLTKTYWLFFSWFKDVSISHFGRFNGYKIILLTCDLSKLQIRCPSPTYRVPHLAPIKISRIFNFIWTIKIMFLFFLDQSARFKWRAILGPLYFAILEPLYFAILDYILELLREFLFSNNVNGSKMRGVVSN